MKKFVKFVGRFPFAGKLTIRPLVFGLYQSDTREERRWRFGLCCVFLGLFIYFHMAQAWLGIRVLQHDAPTWAWIVSALYAAINLSVVIAQAHLAYRSTRFFLTGAYPRMHRAYARYSPVEALGMFIVTLSGQMFFMWQYKLYCC